MGIKIKAENLIKIYGDHPEEAMTLLKQGHTRDEILKRTGQTLGVLDANFEVGEGEIFVLIGLSGSGKSTLLRCLNGLNKLTSGSLYIDGQAVHSMTDNELRIFRGEKMGMVFQHFAILPNRTILENVAFGLEIKNVPVEERLSQAADALKQVGLEAWADRLPSDLSGGMKQRVGLARALVLKSDILLMDEPFSALDALIRGEMQEELVTLQQEIHKTIVFVTHDLDEALRLGDKIAIMRDGVIQQIGSAEEILANPATDYVARFLESVDVSKILLSENIARRPQETLRDTEGLMVASRKLDKIDADYLFVLGFNRTLKGYITVEDVLQMLERGERDLAPIIKPADVVQTGITMQELYPVVRKAEKAVAVVDEYGRFIGEITRRSLLKNLAERKGS